MAIEFVGKAKATKAGATSGNSTITLSSGLTGGSRSAVAQGDMVIAVFATGSDVDRTLAITDGTTDYTTLLAEQAAAWGDGFGDFEWVNLRTAYKFMGASPDGSVTFGPTGHADDAGAMQVWVFSGVDQSSPNDVTPTTSTSGGGAVKPNPAAITPSTAGAKIFVVGAGSATGAVADYTTPDLDTFDSNNSTDTKRVMLGVGFENWTSGSFNPGTFTGGQNSLNYAAATIALRPAPIPVGRADETDTAFALTRLLKVSSFLATEADTAFALTAKAIGAAARANETDTALALAITPFVGVALETDTAFALATRLLLGTGRANETDTALALGLRFVLPVGRANETDLATALIARAITATGRANEADSAFALPKSVLLPTLRADELDEAWRLFRLLVTPPERRFTVALSRAAQRRFTVPLSRAAQRRFTVEE